MRYTAGTYSIVTEPGKATAYRWLADTDFNILGVEFVDFSCEHDFVEDGEVEEIPEADWRNADSYESRTDECYSQVREYIKTTDQPLATYGCDMNKLPHWGRHLLLLSH